MDINHGQGIGDPFRNGFILVMDAHKFFDEFGKTFLHNARSHVLHQTQLKWNRICCGL